VIYLNRRFFLVSINSAKTNYLGLLVCAALFLCGCIIGTVTAGFISDGTKLNDYISGYLSIFMRGSSSSPGLMTAIVDCYKYHLFAVFLGFSILGVFCIPVLSAVRGFFLSFSISVIIRLLGSKGILLALSIFGINTLLTIPCFFILSVSAFSASLYILRLVFSKNVKSTVSPFDSRFFLNCGICLVVLMISALIDTYLTPYLISYAASHI
jgi:stage II sporulation protein M